MNYFADQWQMGEGVAWKTVWKHESHLAAQKLHTSAVKKLDVDSSDVVNFRIMECSLFFLSDLSL